MMGASCFAVPENLLQYLFDVLFFYSDHGLVIGKLIIALFRTAVSFIECLAFLEIPDRIWRFY